MSINDDMMKAGFVLLFDTFIKCKKIKSYNNCEINIDILRRLIPLSLNDCIYDFNETISIDKAFTLLYEGVGKYREENDFTFKAEHLNCLWKIRNRIDLSYTKCVSKLKKINSY